MLNRPSACSDSGNVCIGEVRGKIHRKDDEIFLLSAGVSSCLARFTGGRSWAVGLTVSADSRGILDVLALSMLERVAVRMQRIEGDFLSVGVFTKGSSHSRAGEAFDGA